MSERDIGKPEDKGQSGGQGQLSHHVLERHIDTAVKTAQHTADMVNAGQLPSFHVMGGESATARAGNSQIQQQQQQGERTQPSDRLQLAVMPREYSNGHVEIPTAEQVRHAPIDQLHKIFEGNQNSLVGAIKNAWHELPNLGYHGTTKEGAEGLNRDQESNGPFYIGTVWKKAGDAVGHLGDMMRSIGFASGYAKEGGQVVIVDPGFGRTRPDGSFPGVTHHNPDASPNPMLPPGEHTGETTISIDKGNFADRVKGMISPDKYRDLQQMYGRAVETAEEYTRALLGDAFFRQGMVHDALVAVGVIKDGQQQTRGGEGQQREGQAPGKPEEPYYVIDDGDHIGRGGNQRNFPGGGEGSRGGEGQNSGGNNDIIKIDDGWHIGGGNGGGYGDGGYGGGNGGGRGGGSGYGGGEGGGGHPVLREPVREQPPPRMEPQPARPEGPPPRMQPQPEQPGDDPRLTPQPDRPGGGKNGGTEGEKQPDNPGNEEIFNPTKPPGIDGMNNGDKGSDRPDHIDWRDANQTALMDGSTKYDYSGQLTDRSKDGTGHDTKVDFSSSVVVGPDGKTILGSTTNYDPPVDQNYAAKDMRADSKIIPEHGPKVEIEGVQSVSTMRNPDGSQTSIIVGKKGTYIFETDNKNVVRDVIGPDGKHID